MRIRRIRASLLLLVFATGCGSAEPGTASHAEPAAAAAPLELIGAIVRAESVVEPIFGTGTIVADKTTELGPVVPGIVEAIHVEEGDRVAAGDPLFRTRQVDYQIGREEAGHAARLAAAEAAKAERDWKRAKRLHGQGVASQGRLDDARTAWEIASARRQVAEAALARARQNLDDTQVVAPYAGVITRRYVDEGVRMGGMAAPGAVVQLMKVDVVEAVIQVPEKYVGRVREGMAARVQLDGIGGTFESTVGTVNPMADPESRAFEVRVPIDNPELVVRPGLFARAELFPEARAALVLERAAVLGSGERRYVYVEEEGAARRRFVRVRELDALRLEVVDGLAEGDRVLAGPNLPTVTEGAAVTVHVARADH